MRFRLCKSLCILLCIDEREPGANVPPSGRLQRCPVCARKSSNRDPHKLNRAVLRNLPVRQTIGRTVGTNSRYELSSRPRLVTMRLGPTALRLLIWNIAVVWLACEVRCIVLLGTRCLKRCWREHSHVSCTPFPRFPVGYSGESIYPNSPSASPFLISFTPLPLVRVYDCGIEPGDCAWYQL